MIVKDMYQSGINILIDGFKALMDEAQTNEIPNYGAKSNTMFDHCQITFLVSDIRGVELITLKNLANKVEVLTKNAFNSPKKLRPTIFSNEYPSVTTTEEYKRFADVTSKVVQKNITMVDGLPEEMRTNPALYRYNFAGSVAFDALVTFSGSNITQLIGVFPGQALRNKDGSWIDPDGQYFINKAVASFKKIYYDALEGIFGTVDMQTDVVLEKLYFTTLRNRDLSALNPDAGKIPNVLYAQAIHPMGSIDLLSSSRPATVEARNEYDNVVLKRMDYVDSVVTTTIGESVFGLKGDFLMNNTTFIMYARCSIQTLLMLSAYTNIVSYYTDMKNVLGVSDIPSTVITDDENGIKIDGKVYEFPKEESSALIASKNQCAAELIKDIEAEKTDILGVLRKYHKERDFYEENRYKNTKLRPPKSMIQRKEYYNMVPLYAQTCCVLKFTANDIKNIESVESSCFSTNLEFRAISAAMHLFYNTAKKYLSTFNK